MAMQINGVSLTGTVKLGADIIVSSDIGIRDTDTAPPPTSTTSGAVKVSSPVSFVQTDPAPGPFAFASEFNQSGPVDLNGIAVDSYTPALHYPDGYVWTVKDFSSATVSTAVVENGNVLIPIDTYPQFYVNGQEFDMRSGLYVEFMINALTPQAGILVGLAIGNSNISIECGGAEHTSGAYVGALRVDTQGFNGYTNADGTMLAGDPTASPQDPASYSQSYTLSRVYSAQSGTDWSNKAIRVELTPTHYTVYADNAVIISLDTAITLDLFASASYKSADSQTSYSADTASIIFGGFGGTDFTVNYLRVGSL